MSGARASTSFAIPFADEACCEFTERHLRLQLRQPMASFVEFIAKLPIDGFRPDDGWMCR